MLPFSQHSRNETQSKLPMNATPSKISGSAGNPKQQAVAKLHAADVYKLPT
jgi:hypothetical protein